MTCSENTGIFAQIAIQSPFFPTFMRNHEQQHRHYISVYIIYGSIDTIIYDTMMAAANVNLHDPQIRIL